MSSIPPPLANSFVIGTAVINTHAPDPLMVGIRSPDGLVVGFAPASFGFDSQTRGTRENRAPPCVKVLSGTQRGPRRRRRRSVLKDRGRYFERGPGGGGGGSEVVPATAAEHRAAPDSFAAPTRQAVAARKSRSQRVELRAAACACRWEEEDET